MEGNGTKTARANFEACIGNHPDREPNPGEPVGPDDPNATDERGQLSYYNLLCGWLETPICAISDSLAKRA
jgi:hypothetical protein